MDEKWRIGIIKLTSQGYRDGEDQDSTKTSVIAKDERTESIGLNEFEAEKVISFKTMQEASWMTDISRRVHTFGPIPREAFISTDPISPNGLTRTGAFSTIES